MFLGDTTKDDFPPGCDVAVGGSRARSSPNGQTWLNGVAVDGTTTTRPTDDVGAVGAADGGSDGGPPLRTGKHELPWVGDIAELIVYTQPITASQRKSVEDYLALKYAAYVATAGAPEFTPERGDVRRARSR